MMFLLIGLLLSMSPLALADAGSGTSRTHFREKTKNSKQSGHPLLRIPAPDDPLAVLPSHLRQGSPPSPPVVGTGSSAGFSGGGSATNGQVQSGLQSISSMNNDIPQATSQSQNTASGTSISIDGYTNTGLNLDPADAVINPTYSGNNLASSNGNAMTGTLQNSDQSHSNTSGQQHYSIGQSQFTGNGTGMSMHGYGSASVYRKEYTTPSPYTTRSYCYTPGCSYSCSGEQQYCYCICYMPGIAPTTVTYAPTPFSLVESEGGKKNVAPDATSSNRQRKPAPAAEKKQRKAAGTQGRARQERHKAPTQSRRALDMPQQKQAHDQHRSRAVI